MASEVFSTTCVLDCPDTCALKVTVVDDKVTSLTGSKDHPITSGIICNKVGRFARRLYHEDRILFPQKRSGPKGSGQFERISWEEAVAEITEKFKAITSKHGAEAILPYYYSGSNGFLSGGFTDALYFARLGASQLDTTVCAAPTSAASQGMYGKIPGISFEDVLHSKFILIWGQNPKFTSIHMASLLKEAHKLGAFIAVIDPINHFSPTSIDLHLPIRPGTDLVLALALIHYWRESRNVDDAFLAEWSTGSETLFAQASQWSLSQAAEICGLDENQIRLLADRYAATSPALLRCGWGQERNSNGGQASAAIFAIPAVLGKFGVRGGGLLMSNSRATKFNAAALLKMPEQNTRVINMTQLADVLESEANPPVKGLFVYNNNPVATTPGQARLIHQLEREDLFCVVSEQVFTDTALYADILLPAVTFLETHDIRRSYGAYVVGGVRAVVAPQGEARSNHEMFSLLAKAMGFSDAAFHWSQEEAFDRVAAEIELGSGGAPDLASLQRGEVVRSFEPGEEPIQFKNVFPATPTGKIVFDPAELGPNPYRYRDLAVAGYPLSLISPATNKMITSTFGEFNYPSLAALIHPDDAAARQIAAGDKVRVFNEMGEVVCLAELSASIAPGVVCLPKGAWRKSSLNGFTSTALCPTTINEVGGGACYNDARVEIARWEG